MKSAEAAIVEAHHAQTTMPTNEAQGIAAEITLLTIHSQDHLMTAIAFCDLAKEIIAIHQRIEQDETKMLNHCSLRVLRYFVQNQLNLCFLTYRTFFK